MPVVADWRWSKPVCCRVAKTLYQHAAAKYPVTVDNFTLSLGALIMLPQRTLVAITFFSLLAITFDSHAAGRFRRRCVCRPVCRPAAAPSAAAPSAAGVDQKTVIAKPPKEMRTGWTAYYGFECPDLPAVPQETIGEGATEDDACADARSKADDVCTGHFPLSELEPCLFVPIEQELQNSVESRSLQAPSTCIARLKVCYCDNKLWIHNGFGATKNEAMQEAIRMMRRVAESHGGVRWSSWYSIECRQPK
jgi:hypothetical protein